MATDEGPYLLAAGFFETATLPEHRMSLAAMRTVIHLAPDPAAPADPLRADLLIAVLIAAAPGHAPVKVEAVLIAPSGARHDLLSVTLAMGNEWVMMARDRVFLVQPEIGRHWCSVRLDGQEVTRVPLSVQLRDPRTRSGQLPA